MAEMTSSCPLSDPLPPDFILFDAQPATAPDIRPKGVSPPMPPQANPQDNHESVTEQSLAGNISPLSDYTPIRSIMGSDMGHPRLPVQGADLDIDTCSTEFLSELRIYSNRLTVSPDSQLHDLNLSAPNSIALTTLTSPSLANDSPMFSSPCQVSPQFEDIDYNASEWFSLFPVDNVGSGCINRTDLSEDHTRLKADHEGKGTCDVALTSSYGQAHRHSHSSGVNRRRTKPLPPIIVEDHNDHVAMKRARNTIAARKSRQRKAQRVEDLESEIMRLTADRDYWRQLAESRAL